MSFVQVFMSASSFFSQLYVKSSEITPYLCGYEGEVELKAIRPQQSNAQVVQELYSQIEQRNPEAGSAYWLTRTWSLLCWQPTYLAFISVYGFQRVPTLTQLIQYKTDCFVTGYQFDELTVEQGELDQVIVKAGEQLRRLFDEYREDMANWTRIRPGFADHIFGDAIIACLLQCFYAQQVSREQVFEHARLWLNACRLPLSLTDTLLEKLPSEQLVQVRKSCCLIYKCDGRGLCANCPRLPENKELLAR
ncbi:siderophore ferric iron reductase [Vibrio olivae]|uniref:Siderophore ferric iron reductase n=1 Tax=Vibrio olivae TaxID=1243002 RepID=A0ABV5HIK5_9VIBR